VSDPGLSERIEAIAQAPVLLVASDYDGTLAPIVDDPAQATPHREVLVALKSLATMPQTHVAVISGRALKELARLTGAPEEVHLVGSHGSEFDLDYPESLPPHAAKLRERIERELDDIASEHDGFIVEKKPASIAFHYRQVDGEAAKSALQRIEDGPGGYEGVITRRGKEVVELAVVSTSKGDALETVRRRIGASATIFFGDDRTDEDAFSTLKGPDVAVKVGPGETAARHRAEDPDEVARLLARLVEARAKWLAGSEAVPIEEHAMLSDLRTVALVTPDARIGWLCAPRIDSPSLFAELLGGPAAGRFVIRDAGGAKPNEQRYLDASHVLRTEWPRFSVTDYLDTSGGRPLQRAGRTDLVRVIEGSGTVEIVFAPRLDFSRTETRLTARDGGLEIEDTPDPIVLRSPGVEWTLTEEGRHQTARATVTLTPDEPLVLELRYGTGNLRASVAPEVERRRRTEAWWTGWASRLRLPAVATDQVLRSALAIKALCYEPTGAICAAGTTSLPEHMGGVRNWDYRYCWLRDAAMGAASLVRLGSTSEAMRFLDWVLHIVDEAPSPERLHPLYSVTGHHLAPEAEISELSGYSGSRPVRVGNAASRQIQLDVFGPIVELVRLLAEVGAPISSEHWRLVEAMVAAVERRWTEPDHGIWEVRTSRRHHVHSKVMCWVTADRGATIAEQFLGRERQDWKDLRDAIATDTLEQGWNEEVGAFTAAYGETAADAAVLEIGLRGLLSPDDPRFLATVHTVERELRYGPTVYRYLCEDGLPGFEGGFHLCTAWLIESYLLTEKIDEAWALFNGMCALAGRTGLMSEQYGPRSKRALGNHPQVYSHLGLIDCAVRLSRIEAEAPSA